MLKYTFSGAQKEAWEKQYLPAAYATDLSYRYGHVDLYEEKTLDNVVGAIHHAYYLYATYEPKPTHCWVENDHLHIRVVDKSFRIMPITPFTPEDEARVHAKMETHVKWMKEHSYYPDYWF